MSDEFNKVRKEMIRIRVIEGDEPGMFFVSGLFPDITALLGHEVDTAQISDVIFDGLTEAAKKSFSFALMNKGQWCSQYGVSNEDSLTEFQSKDGEITTRDVTKEYEDFDKEE